MQKSNIIGMEIDKSFCLKRIDEQIDYIAKNDWLYFTAQMDYDRYNLINQSAQGILNYFLAKLKTFTDEN